MGRSSSHRRWRTGRRRMRWSWFRLSLASRRRTRTLSDITGRSARRSWTCMRSVIWMKCVRYPRVGCGTTTTSVRTCRWTVCRRWRTVDSTKNVLKNAPVLLSPPVATLPPAPATRINNPDHQPQKPLLLNARTTGGITPGPPGMTATTARSATRDRRLTHRPESLRNRKRPPAAPTTLVPLTAMTCEIFPKVNALNTNGAGGSRTPVPVQSAMGFYTFSHS